MPEPIQPEELARRTAVLHESGDSAQILDSALVLAASEDREALIALARALRLPGFFARLEGAEGPTTEDLSNLISVFVALTEHPTEFTGRLCELLYAEQSFHELPSRLNPLLRALGAVKPVTPRAVAIFRETSAQDFAQVNGPILLANGEPPALEVFAEIITGDWVEAYVKVDILHRALLPVRDRLPVIQMCIRLLTSPLEEEVRHGLIESLYDYRSKEWFGPAMFAPKPPDWNQAPDASLEMLIRLAGKLLGGPLPAGLVAAVTKTRDQLTEILRGRRL